MRKNIRLLGLLTSLVLTACGGGGGGGSSTPAPTSFALSDPVFDQVGGTSTFNLTGSDSDGDDLTAVYTKVRRADDTFDGQPAQVFDILVSLTDVTTGGFTTISFTEYRTADGTFLGDVDNDDGVECAPDGQQTPLPPTAEIGDIGFLGSTICTDGETDSSNWRLDAKPGSSQLANLLIFFSTAQTGFEDSDEEQTYTIDASGNISGIRFRFADASGFSFDISS